VFSGVRRRVSGIVLLLAAAACARDDAARSASQSHAIEVGDDAGFTVRLQKPAQRIVSLIPSATEALVAIGATSQIVGRTRYDVDPALSSLPSVGGGLDPSVEAIVNLHPDLVVSWESDKRQLVREKLTGFGIPVFILRAQDTADVFRGIGVLGRLAGRDSAATAVAARVRATLDSVRASVAGRKVPTVFYAEFTDPPMTVGPRTFIGQLITLAGGRSIFDDTDQLWPSVALEEILRRDPDLIVVPVGEFPENSVDRFRKMAGWRSLRAVREGRVIPVPADLMSRPSPSIAAAARVLQRAFHPGTTSERH
jgi:iron complex transport system substrate-binding protein